MRSAGEYPRWDSNPRSWLRRPALYPLSYGGATAIINIARRPDPYKYEPWVRSVKDGLAESGLADGETCAQRGQMALDIEV